jgi:hypothetical protein
MAVSRTTPGRTDTSGRYLSLLGGLSRYDLLLALVPLGFGLALLAHVVTDVSLLTAVAAGAVLGLAVLVDALFVNPPTGNTPRNAP